MTLPDLGWFCNLCQFISHNFWPLCLAKHRHGLNLSYFTIFWDNILKIIREAYSFLSWIRNHKETSMELLVAILSIPWLLGRSPLTREENQPQKEAKEIRVWGDNTVRGWEWPRPWDFLLISQFLSSTNYLQVLFYTRHCIRCWGNIQGKTVKVSSFKTERGRRRQTINKYTKPPSDKGKWYEGRPLIS